MHHQHCKNMLVVSKKYASIVKEQKTNYLFLKPKSHFVS